MALTQPKTSAKTAPKTVPQTAKEKLEGQIAKLQARLVRAQTRDEKRVAAKTRLEEQIRLQQGEVPPAQIAVLRQKLEAVAEPLSALALLSTRMAMAQRELAALTPDAAASPRDVMREITRLTRAAVKRSRLNAEHQGEKRRAALLDGKTEDIRTISKLNTRAGHGAHVQKRHSRDGHAKRVAARPKSVRRPRAPELMADND